MLGQTNPIGVFKVDNSTTKSHRHVRLLPTIAYLLTYWLLDFPGLQGSNDWVFSQRLWANLIKNKKRSLVKMFNFLISFCCEFLFLNDVLHSMYVIIGVNI